MRRIWESTLKVVGEDLEADDPALRAAAREAFDYYDGLHSTADLDPEVAGRLIRNYEEVKEDVRRAGESRPDWMG